MLQRIFPQHLTTYLQTSLEECEGNFVEAIEKVRNFYYSTLLYNYI